MQADFEFTSKDTKTYIGTQDDESFSGWNAVLNQEEVVDNLESTAADLPLSANQGTQLFNDVSTGKAAIASAITDKQIETASTATFQTMAENIGQIGATPLFDNIKLTDLGVQQPDSYYGKRTGFKKGEYNLLLILGNNNMSTVLGTNVYSNDTLSFLRNFYFKVLKVTNNSSYIYYTALLFIPTGDEVEFFDIGSYTTRWVLVEGINELLENGYNFDWDTSSNDTLRVYLGKESTLCVAGVYFSKDTSISLCCSGDIVTCTDTLKTESPSTGRIYSSKVAAIANLKGSQITGNYYAESGAFQSREREGYVLNGLIFYKK